jgi:hypothetical protein
MDNQHKKITGYRDLSQSEIDLMNDIKQLAAQVGDLIDSLKSHGDIHDQRWIAEGKTDLQKGFMSLVRGIAQPSTF